MRVATEVAGSALRHLTQEVLGRRPICLVYRREMLVSAPVRNVIAFIAAVMREHAAMISGAETAKPARRNAQ